MSTKLTLGFSSCPNDTFIFDALIHQLIDTEGLQFEPVIEDVETLNAMAEKGELDISKMSYRALLDELDKYKILCSGGALGQGCGPLLISRKGTIPEGWDMAGLNQNIGSYKIAIPGRRTTANMLLHFALPDVKDATPLLFSEIEDAVLDGKYDLGLIIHESRFTYESRGLHKVADMGAYWEEQTGCPIPLGGIAIKKEFSLALQKKVDRLIKKSVTYSFKRYPELSPFIQQHAKEMNPQVMRQHIELYVNDYSIDLGEKGQQAIFKMMEVVSGKATTPSPAWFV